MTGHSRESALVLAGKDSRFVYTIGLSPALGFELLFAGGSDYSNSEAAEIVNVIAKRMPDKGAGQSSVMSLGDLGSFSFREVHPSWANELMLGAFDYFATRNITARQIVPDASVEWNARSAPAWKHLQEPWSLPFSPDDIATTNLAALRGGRITNAFRRGEHHWEMFAGTSKDVDSESKRDVTLATLFVADPGLLPAIEMEVGAGLQRPTADAPWQPS